MQKILSLNNRDFLLVKLPEGSTNIQVSEVSRMMYYIIKNEVVNAIELPEGKWVILIPDCGRCSEEDAAKVVEKLNRMYVYMDYIKKDWLRTTALESLSTLLEREKIYSVNPMTHPSDIDPIQMQHYDQIKQEWEEAQSYTGTWCWLEKIK